MKKIISVILLMGMLFMIAGCTASDEETTEGHPQHENEMWYPASCLAPKTCGVCGYTEGEKGEHSVQVGTCFYCKEFMNKELADEIKAELDALCESLVVSYEFLKEKSDDPDKDEITFSAAIEAVADDFDNEKENLKNALALCGEYSELSKVKDSLETALKGFPVMPEGTAMEDCEAYFNSARDCYFYILTASYDVNYIS